MVENNSRLKVDFRVSSTQSFQTPVVVLRSYERLDVKQTPTKEMERWTCEAELKDSINFHA